MYITSLTGLATSSLEFRFLLSVQRFTLQPPLLKRFILFAERLQVAHGSPNSLLFVLTVHSFGLYSTLAALQEVSDYRIRPAVARIIYSFECVVISFLQWMPGHFNYVYVLTKRNLDMFRRLKEVLKSGVVKPTIFGRTKRRNNDQQPSW